MPSCLSGRYAAVKVRKKLYVTKLRDGKPITDMKLGLVERFALKEALKKVRGTDIEKVLKEFEAI